MSQEVLDRLAQIQTDLKSKDEETKKQFGAIEDRLGKTLTKEEYEERRAEAKTELASKEDVRAMVKESVDAATEAFADHRTAELVPEIGDRSYFREAAALCKTKEEASNHLERFLTSKPHDDGMKRFHEVATKLHILQRYGSWNAVQRGLHPYNVATSKNLEVRRMWRDYQRLGVDYLGGEEFFQRAFDTADASEWVPTVLASDLMRYIEVRGQLIPNIRTFPLPAASWNQPYTTGAGFAYRFVEVTASPTAAPNYLAGAAYASDNAPAGARAFAVERLRGKLISSREFIEESIIPALDFMVQDTADQIRRSIEDAMINGDSASPLLDSDTVVAVTNNVTTHRTCWDGWRHLAAANDAASNTEVPVTSNHVTVGNAITLRTSMGRYAVDPSSTMWVCGVKSYLDLLDLPEMLTMEKVGSLATALTGQLGSFLGIPLVVSEFIREDLDANGVYTTSTNSQTIQILVHRPLWWLGNWRGITTEPERLAAFNMDVVWAWWSGDFQKIAADAEPTEGALTDID